MLKKIKIEDLLPNPFRNIEKYPVDEDRVESLMETMSEETGTGIWKNFTARPHKTLEGKYELVAGMHRITAVRRLGVQEIEVFIEDISDHHMLRRLIDENATDNIKRSVKYINENVESAKNYIEKHIAEKNGVYEDLDDWCKNLFESEHGFDVAIGMGNSDTCVHVSLGWQILLNFLGTSWTKAQVQFALLHLPKNEEPSKVSRSVSEKFETPRQASAVDKVLGSIAGQFAFPTHEAQEKVVSEILSDIKSGTDGETKLSSSVIEERLNQKVEEKLGYKMAGHDPTVEVFSKESDEERPSSILENRRYFRKLLRGFNAYTKNPGDVPMYPRHIAFEDFNTLQLVANDIIHRLAEYEALYGFVLEADAAVFDYFDEVEIKNKYVKNTISGVDNMPHSDISFEDWLFDDASWEEALEKRGGRQFSDILDEYLQSKVDE